MLPKLLTETLCSLKSEVDRLAFSVIVEIDKNTNVNNLIILLKNLYQYLKLNFWFRIYYDFKIIFNF